MNRFVTFLTLSSSLALLAGCAVDKVEGTVTHPDGSKDSYKMSRNALIWKAQAAQLEIGSQKSTVGSVEGGSDQASLKLMTSMISAFVPLIVHPVTIPPVVVQPPAPPVVVPPVVTNVSPVVVPMTNTPPSSPIGVDDVDVQLLHQTGKHARPNFNALPITRKLLSAKIDSGKVSWQGENLWQASSGMGGWCQMYWLEGGQLVGGTFDAFKNGQHLKGLENIEGGYIDGHIPAKGSQMYLGLTNNGETSSSPSERTNLVLCDGTW